MIQEIYQTDNSITNTSLAAPGALQHRTVCNTYPPPLNPKWLTGSGIGQTLGYWTLQSPDLEIIFSSLVSWDLGQQFSVKMRFNVFEYLASA